MRYAHTNIVARDWRSLAKFYEGAFDCAPVPPARDLAEPWLARGTGVANARLSGIHLRLPGHGDRGPTLEIFQYSEELERSSPIAANRIGYGHLAFEVEDVERQRQRVLAAGGTDVGNTVTAAIPGAGTITFVYVADPEGNLIELQSWS